jgi:hypothetical protein
MRLFSAIILTAILSCITVNAQEKDIVSDTLEIYFHQGYSTWDPEYMENGRRLEEFVERFRNIHNDETFGKISKIKIIAGCSPEGTWKLNQRLSQNRVNRIRRVLESYIALPDSLVIADAVGINWEALYKLVEADPNVPHQAEVLDIMANTPELHVNQFGKTVELRKQRLIWNNDGRAWEYMTVVLSDMDKQSDGSRLKNITLSDDGVWKIVESSWSWSYEPDVQSIQRELRLTSTSAERTFIFTNTPKQNVPQHGEGIKINKIK